MSHEHINPSLIVPLGPVPDFMRPLERARPANVATALL